MDQKKIHLNNAFKEGLILRDECELECDEVDKKMSDLNSWKPTIDKINPDNANTYMYELCILLFSKNYRM